MEFLQSIFLIHKSRERDIGLVMNFAMILPESIFYWTDGHENHAEGPQGG